MDAFFLLSQIFKEAYAMKESEYKSYDELPLFLNAETVAEALGVSPSTGYELLRVLGFNALRHTFATLALQNDVDVKTVSGMLGHYSAGFTLDTYAHVTTTAQTQAANTMDSVLSLAVLS